MLTPLTDGDPRFIGPYRLTNRIGAGGMGAVYLGFDDHEQAAAVKVPFVDRADDPQFRSRFSREVQAVSRVRGSCVAQLLDADPDAERPWMAAEFVEGASLGDAVKSRGAVEPRILNGLAVGLADALVSIHSAGVVHRDLKPSNILLAWDGPKVIDFGIAKAEDSLDYTKTGMLVGTLVWMAPEQLRGYRAGPAADVFAWGACLAYAATGRAPFQAEGMHAVALQILNTEPDLDGVPEHLLPHVYAALSKEPEQRPTATQLLAALVGRDVVNAADADSAARTALGNWAAAPPTASRTAMIGRPDDRDDRSDRDRTGLAPVGYARSGQGGPGPGGPGSTVPGPGGPGHGAGKSGMSPTTAAVAVIVLLLVAGGIALALMLSSGGDGDPGPGVVPTSSVSASLSASAEATPGEPASSGPTSSPDNQPTGTRSPDSTPSRTPSPEPTQPTSGPTPTPTPTPTVAPPTTAAPTQTVAPTATEPAGSTVGPTP